MSFSFKEWYALNGARLNAQRKAKYHNDPEYRDKVLSTNQESRQRRKKSQKEQRQAENPAVRMRPREKTFKTVDAVVDGVSVQLFTIGALAKALGCSIQAIRLWERQGIIPKTELRSDKGESGDRLYTEEMVETFRAILTAQGRLRTQLVKGKPKDRPLLRWVKLKNGRVQQIPLYLIGVLARHVGRNVVTLEQLESRGLLPRTPFRTSSVGRRLYTGAMINSVKKAFRAHGGDIRGEEAWKAFHDDVLARWTEEGVVGARLLEKAPKAASEVSDEQGLADTGATDAPN